MVTTHVRPKFPPVVSDSGPALPSGPRTVDSMAAGLRRLPDTADNKGVNP